MELPDGKKLPTGTAAKLRTIPQSFTMEQAQKSKDTENVTNHAVKAVEYVIKEQFDLLGLQPSGSSCTSG